MKVTTAPACRTITAIRLGQRNTIGPRDQANHRVLGVAPPTAEAGPLRLTGRLADRSLTLGLLCAQLFQS